MGKKMAKGATPKKGQIPTEEFVTIVVKGHNVGKTISDIARDLGRPTTSVYQRYLGLKKKGVKLPSFGRKKRLDVDALNKMIAGLKK